MFLLTRSARPVVAATALLSALVVANPLPAAWGGFTPAAAAALSSGQDILAQAAPAESSSAETKASKAVDARVEARIKAMHRRLHITSAQDTQWNAVAEVMRDNAQTLGDLREEGAEQSKSMTAIDQLKSYEAITDAQAAGIHKFIPAFQALYDTMSDTQKKTTDTVFRSRAAAAAAKRK